MCKTNLGALSIQQKKPVEDFGIFAGQMERVPEPVNHVRRHTGHAGLFENTDFLNVFAA